MNQYISLPAPAKQSPESESQSFPYKIYVGFDKDRFGNINHIDIIDGYLRDNEQLELKTQYVHENGIAIFEIQIVPAPKLNTFLQVKSEIPLLNSILVKVFQSGKCVGYQYTDISGNIMLLPKNVLLKSEFIKGKI